MAQEASTLNAINWRQAFPFTHVFRAFRVAVHPSKLILALMALTALYVGGRLLDSVWPLRGLAVVEVQTWDQGDGHANVQTEIERFAEFQRDAAPGASFAKVRAEMRQHDEDMYVENLLLDLGIYKDEADARTAAHNGWGLRDVEHKLIERRDQAVKEADDTLAAFEAAASHVPDPVDRATRLREAREAHDQEVRAQYATAAQTYEKAQILGGQGVFAQFFDYEVRQINNVVDGVLAGNWLGGIRQKTATPGVFASVLNFVSVAPVWMMRCHPAYFVLFTILFLVVWAIFGGAIARIAAVHVARDERISVRAALRFSMAKFLSFIFAPIIPLLIVLFLGLAVLLCGLIGDISFIGPPVVGLLFFLALGAGFVMTLVLLGTAGGFNLMYPTIAVEGSDSFDAISRSFSYVYAKPWRLLFLTVLAVVYGALTYEFVHLFVHLLLALTHYFVGLSMNLRHASNLSPQWETMWPMNWGRLSYHVDWMSLRWDQSLGAAMVEFWVYLMVAIVGAYSISFYFSVNTIIYFLMRREVDATEMEDVYMEQVEEELAEPAGPEAGGPADAGPPAGDAPPADAPAS